MPWSVESRAKVGKWSRENNSMKNPETVKKASETRRGQKRTPEQCERIRLSILRRDPVSDETRKKMSVSHKGKKFLRNL